MYYWFALAFILLIMELFSGSLYMLFIAIAFAIVGLIEVIFGTSLNINLVIASILIVINVLIVRKFNRRQSKQPAESNDFDIGQMVEVLSYEQDGTARIFYRGVEWEGRLVDISEAAGSEAESIKARIVAKEGNTLLVKLI